MSTDKTAPRNVPARFADNKMNSDEAAEVNQSAVQNVEVTWLQVDESYDVDCDPYNCTGQHLVDALKTKYNK